LLAAVPVRISYRVKRLVVAERVDTAATLPVRVAAADQPPNLL